MTVQQASRIEAAAVTFQAGDRLPLCYGMAAEGSFYSSEQQCGRAAVMILAGAATMADLPSFIASFAAAMPRFVERDADVLLIGDRGLPALAATVQPPMRAVDCGPFLHDCGVGAGSILVVVVDRNMRVALRAQSEEPGALVSACLEALDHLPREAGRAIVQPAPVIVLPNVLPREFCANLIALFNDSPSIDGEIARVNAEGVACSVVDHAKKRRRDMPIGPGHVLHEALQGVLLSRCAPEIAKAYRARIAHIDRILVARYDAPEGWFRRHRDNAAPNVAFREFAFSISLNAEDYDGGDLLFPEYNDHRYRPPTGGAVMFSAALLHEVTPVTHGSRYVLLGFMHGEAAEARRLAYLAEQAVSQPLVLSPVG